MRPRRRETDDEHSHRMPNQLVHHYRVFRLIERPQDMLHQLTKYSELILRQR